MNQSSDKLRLLFVSIAPPENNHGVRVVMYRHLVDRTPFELHTVSDADSWEDDERSTRLKIPYLLHRLRKSRFGRALSSWLRDYENFVWIRRVPQTLQRAVDEFKPDLVLTLADNSLSRFARQVARERGIPLAVLFLDWFPIMRAHYGHHWTCGHLDKRFRRLYRDCDLAICTSDGMKEVLGSHPNSHVVYPMPGRHAVPTALEKTPAGHSGKFRLVYVGSVASFYGRMICSLIESIGDCEDLELVVVGPNADWPSAILERAKANGTYLGFKPPEEAAGIIATADALLVVMSFETEHRLFMETSFTTKFLDYTAYGKPVILWGPEYCTPVRVARRERGAQVVDQPEASGVIDACREISSDPGQARELAGAALRLRSGLFNPDRLQEVFVRELERLVGQSVRNS